MGCSLIASARASSVPGTTRRGGGREERRISIVSMCHAKEGKEGGRREGESVPFWTSSKMTTAWPWHFSKCWKSVLLMVSM